MEDHRFIEDMKTLFKSLKVICFLTPFLRIHLTPSVTSFLRIKHDQIPTAEFIRFLTPFWIKETPTQIRSMRIKEKCYLLETQRGWSSQTQKLVSTKQMKQPDLKAFISFNSENKGSPRPAEEFGEAPVKTRDLRDQLKKSITTMAGVPAIDGGCEA